ncbi:MAG: hypothetical protein ABIR96_09555 [Bdellovibrionota bacterium]
MKFAARGLLGIFCMVLSASAAEARPEKNGFGFGVSHIGRDQIPQLSVAWKNSQTTTLEGHSGFSTAAGATHFEVGAQFDRNLFIEENQDFYFYLGGSLNSHDNAGVSSSGYSLETGAGSEIFLPGLPNFGLNFSGGFALASGGGTSLQTRVAFGMHYYF